MSHRRPFRTGVLGIALLTLGILGFSGAGSSPTKLSGISLTGANSFNPINVGAPSVAVTPTGNQQLVFWNSGGHLMESWYAGSWNGPVDWTVGAFRGTYLLSSAPSAYVSPDGQSQLVFWNSGGHLVEAWFAGGRWNGPVDWTGAIFGGAATLASAPSVTVAPDGTQLVFWQGTNRHLYEAWYSNGWNGPVDWTVGAFGGGALLSSAPSVHVTPDGRQQIVFWNSNGHLIEAWYSNGWHGPADWTLGAFGGRLLLSSAPSVYVTPDGSTQTVFWNSGGHLVEAWYVNGWNGPVDWTAGAFGGAGTLTSAPSVAITADGSQQIVFWQGGGSSLYEAWYANGWNGPVDWTPGGVQGITTGNNYQISSPVFQQSLNLDCESAALAVALGAKGISVSDRTVFNTLPVQGQDSQVVNGTQYWGNPYEAFVGNVNGPASEGFGPGHGYGVYYGPIAAAAKHFGRNADGHTGWTAAQVEAQVALGNPVIVWTNEWNGSSFPASGVSYWRSWDNQVIPFTFKEHAVTIIGWNQTNNTITLVDVGWGVKRTISTAALATMMTTFGGMAVAVS